MKLEFEDEKEKATSSSVGPFGGRGELKYRILF
jgi:hypothetical protein